MNVWRDMPAILRPRLVGNTEMQLRQIRRGFAYVGMDIAFSRALVSRIRDNTSGLSKCVIAHACMGPELFWRTTDGPIVSWDLGRYDENRECEVRERPWPFCWGDRIDALAIWDGQYVLLNWDLHLDAAKFLVYNGEIPLRTMAEWYDESRTQDPRRDTIVRLPDEFWAMRREEIEDGRK